MTNNQTTAPEYRFRGRYSGTLEVRAGNRYLGEHAAEIEESRKAFRKFVKKTHPEVYRKSFENE